MLIIEIFLNLLLEGEHYEEMLTLKAFIVLSTITTGFSLCYDVVDLTHTHSNASIRYPDDTPFELQIDYRGPFGTGDWFEINTIRTTEHIGTHADAPAHFAQGSWRAHQIPVDHHVGNGVIINVKCKVQNDVDYRVSFSDVYEWEKTNGRIPDGSVVLMNSGWDVRHPDFKQVFNTTTPNDASTFHFPSWHPDTVNWLITNRRVHVIGVDTPSNDYGPSVDFPVHILLSKNNIVGVENVANLNVLPPIGALIFVNILKILDGSGSPVRIVGLMTNRRMKLKKNCSINSKTAKKQKVYK
ncbi:unnamed protein product [Mytilus coruscus]|uniref:Arylformamidase n=1 Tax=Mytilus coruscus TaxID=42192 RepID=A0A6J8E2Z2_MYTCO|nr:unnamed protein product [Mytilus coruscus]